MATPQVLHDGTGILAEAPGFGILQAFGDEVPADGVSGYATGCTFHHTDGASGSTVYVNDGSNTSCDFNALGR